MTPIDDDACVDILGNCVQNATYTIKPLPGQTSINLSSIVASPAFTNATSYDLQGQFIIDQDYNFATKTFYCEPASEILVNPGKMITFSTCTLSACSKMWKGIRLELNAKLSTRHSSLQGAQYGIKASDRNIITIDATDFISNYIGIYVPDLAAAPQIFNSTSIWIARSRFFGGGVLPDSYQGQKNYMNQLPAKSTIPYAGILAFRIYQLFLGQDPNMYAPNQFFNMSNGIVGKRSNLIKIINCKFFDLIPDPSYYLSSLTAFGSCYNGSAIYGSGNKTQWAINQSGFGGTVNDQFTFKNCKYGIFADRITLASHDNKMEEMTTGYRAQMVRTGVDINNNTIDALQDAIQMIQCDNNNIANSIISNWIVFGNNDVNASYAGINVQENKIQNFRSRIHDNDIIFRTNSTSARYGIVALSSLSLEVTRNRISNADNAKNWDGIHMDDCNSNIISCNIIEATGSIPQYKSDQSAIKNTMGDGPVIACNWMNNSPNGLFVIGQIGVQHNMVVKGNEFHDHFLGLRYGTNTIGQAQDKQGNLWPANPPSGILQAINENPNVNAFIDYYFVHLTNPTPPTNYTYYPTFSASGTPWFKPDPFPFNFNESCDIPVPDYYCDSNFPSAINDVTELDRKIAIDSIENDPYTIETKWMLKKALYSKLIDNPGLLTDSLLNSFNLSMQNSLIADLKNVEIGREGLFDKDTFLISSLDQNLQNYNVAFNLLESQMDLLQQAIENGWNTLSILDDISFLQNTVIDIVTISTGLNETHDQTRNALVVTIESGNSQLVTTYTIEDNEKAVNNIYLATIGHDNFQFTTVQLSTLRSIAIQCPLSGGSAVFRARALLFIAEGTLYYNDRDICWNAGIELKQAAQNGTFKPVVSIHPNPANEQTTVEYTFPTGEQVKYALYSTTGSSIERYTLSETSHSFVINTLKLLPGVYHIALTGSKGTNYNGRLVIIR